MKYAIFLRTFDKKELIYKENLCTTEVFDGPINIGDTILYGDKYTVVDKDIDLQANCYDLYVELIK